MDLGDKNHHVCALNGKGGVESRGTVKNDPESIRDFFSKHRGATVVMETGVHSGWISDLGEDLGMDLVVANSREVRRDMGILKAREALVQSRADLVNRVRSICKNFGYRLKGVGTEAFARKIKLPEELQWILEGLVEQIGQLSEAIGKYEAKVKTLEQKYPQVEKLKQVAGVGPLTSVAYVLMVEDPQKLKRSRDAGAYFGLKPKRDQSGALDKQLRISKVGSEMVRRLLVNASQYIMGRFGPDSDLKRFGLKLASRGGKSAKKRAVIAVARKLAVLLHALWRSDRKYQPLRGNGENGGLLMVT